MMVTDIRPLPQHLRPCVNLKQSSFLLISSIKKDSQHFLKKKKERVKHTWRSESSWIRWYVDTLD